VSPTIKLHRNDLPASVSFAGAVAVDSETLGLKPGRDRLCVVQLSAGDNTAHLVQFDGRDWSAPNLKAVLSNPSIQKIFHFGRFDIAVIARYLGVVPEPVYCTKIASKLARTYTDRHGLKDLARELLNIDMNKQQQSSDWGAEKITDAQMEYAASDVLYLHDIKRHLDRMLRREGRLELAETCFRFLPARIELDLMGWDEEDIFAHS
jgi:ribonuclease D